MRLGRIGFDHVAGYLAGGIDALAAVGVSSGTYIGRRGGRAASTSISKLDGRC